MKLYILRKPPKNTAWKCFQLTAVLHSSMYFSLPYHHHHAASVFPTGIIKGLSYLTSLVDRCSEKQRISKKKNTPPTPWHITCLNAAACGHGTLSKSLNYVPECHKSLSQLFVCVQKLWRMWRAFLRGSPLDFLRVSLAGPDGLAEVAASPSHLLLLLSPLPPSFNRRSNTVANVMCNKTHFHCPLLGPSEWTQSVGNGRYRTHREMADGKPLCAAAGLKRWPRLLWQEFRALGAVSGRGTCLCTHLLTKRRPPPPPPPQPSSPPSPPVAQTLALHWQNRLTHVHNQASVATGFLMKSDEV